MSTSDSEVSQGCYLACAPRSLNPLVNAFTEGEYTSALRISNGTPLTLSSPEGWQQLSNFQKHILPSLHINIIPGSCVSTAVETSARGALFRVPTTAQPTDRVVLNNDSSSTRVLSTLLPPEHPSVLTLHISPDFGPVQQQFWSHLPRKPPC